MFDGRTPSSFVYDDLRSFGGLSNRDAALILLSERPIYGGRSPRDRVGERTFLSREVVHQAPENANPVIYDNFAKSAPAIVSSMARRMGGRAAYAQIAEHYAGDVATELASILDRFRLDGRIYLNTVRRMGSVQISLEVDRATLFVMAFLSAGCLSDPRTAASSVEKYLQSRYNSKLVTIEAEMGSAGPVSVQASQGVDQLGIVRVVDDAVKPPIYALSSGSKGTVVGSIPTEGSCVTDVEVDVSRQHLTIWHQDDRWWCRGLDSTNGTQLISGATKELVIVELPRSLRKGPQDKSQPVEINPGDILCLGLSTRFLVLRMQA